MVRLGSWAGVVRVENETRRITVTIDRSIRLSPGIRRLDAAAQQGHEWETTKKLLSDSKFL